MRPLALAAVALALAACDRPPPRRDPPPPAPSAAPADSARDDALRAAAERVRAWIGRSFPTPRELDTRRCDDAVGAPGPLAYAVVDARADARSVLPLRVTRHLVDPDPAALVMALTGIDPSLPASTALERARFLEAARYVAVYHILDFALPRRFHRPMKRHAEWNAGRLDALLVIHDAKSGAALCRTRITIVGDATGAPLAPRLRSDVRDRLTDALGKRMHDETPAALVRITDARTASARQ